MRALPKASYYSYCTTSASQAATRQHVPPTNTPPRATTELDLEFIYERRVAAISSYEAIKRAAHCLVAALVKAGVRGRRETATRKGRHE